MDTQGDLHARVRHLEGQNRWICSVGGSVALVLVAAWIFLFIRMTSHGTLSATEFRLEDHSGRAVARLSSDAWGACFEILGKSRRGTASLCAGDEMGSSLVLDSAREGARVTLTAGMLLREGPGSLDPGLAISKTNARTAASIFLYKGAHLSLDGPAGDDLLQLSSVGKADSRSQAVHHGKKVAR